MREVTKMSCQTLAPESLSHYDLAIIISTYQSQLLLSRHKKSVNWELQGGPIQEGETFLTAAKRILVEESGAVTYNLQPLCDFVIDDEKKLEGICFMANIYDLGQLGDCEMKERKAFEELPEGRLMYPALTSLLIEKKREFEDQ